MICANQIRVLLLKVISTVKAQRSNHASDLTQNCCNVTHWSISCFVLWEFYQTLGFAFSGVSHCKSNEEAVFRTAAIKTWAVHAKNQLHHSGFQRINWSHSLGFTWPDISTIHIFISKSVSESLWKEKNSPQKWKQLLRKEITSKMCQQPPCLILQKK